MKAILLLLMRFPEIGSRIDQIDLRIDQNDPQIDPPDRPPRLVPRWPPDTHIPDLRYLTLRIGLI